MPLEATAENPAYSATQTATGELGRRSAQSLKLRSQRHAMGPGNMPRHRSEGFDHEGTNMRRTVLALLLVCGVADAQELVSSERTYDERLRVRGSRRSAMICLVIP